MELSKDTFSERKFYQIVAKESKAFLRRQPNWKSNSKNRGTTPKPPLPHCTTWTDTAMPRPTPRTTPNRSSDGSRTFVQLRGKFPIGYNEAHHICHKNFPFPWTDHQTPLPVSSLDPSDLQCTMPNGIRIHSAVFPQSTGQTEAQTDQQMVRGKVRRL